MAEACNDLCPVIQTLQAAANSYAFNTVHRFYPRPAQSQARCIGQLAAAQRASESCTGPRVAGSQEVTSRPLRYLFLRTQVETVYMYDCEVAGDML